MTDKLRKEVRDYIRQQYHLNGGGMVCGNLNDLILGFAEKKEEQIEKLEKIIEQMQDAKCISCTDLGGMQLKINRLEKQIEKMKCCANCLKYDRNNRACSRTKFVVIETLCNCSDGWELRR